MGFGLVEAMQIERVVNRQDARSRRVRLTDEGRKTWRQMQAPIEVFYADALATLSTEECEQLAALLVRLKQGLAKV